MTNRGGSRDLLILVADRDMEYAIRGLLALPQRLRTGPYSYDVRRHPRRDAGCRTQAAEYLRPFVQGFRYAMVIFDLDGSGSHESREDTQRKVERRLSTSGWKGRSKAVVIDPELEAWVWASSSVVAEILGWGPRYRELRSWLESQGLWPMSHPKPPDPKKAVQRAMLEARLRAQVRRSSTKFHDLGRRVSVRGCLDPAFGELRDTLQTWFPEVNDGEG